MSHPYSSVEARVFVRHTSGNLIVPEQPEDSIERLSFTVPLSSNEQPRKQLEELQQDEEAGIDFFHIQHYLGPQTNLVANGERWETPLAHGFLAQSHSPRAPFKQAGRMELPLGEAKNILKDRSSAIDLLDRRLASSAFNVITHGQVHLPPARKEAPATPPSRDRLARDTVRETAVFSKALEPAYGNGPMRAEDLKRLREKRDSLIHSVRSLFDFIEHDANDNA